MKNYLPSESDQESSIKAQVLIYIDKDNKISFGCDWEDNEQGIEAISDIFFELKYKDLLERILTVLYKQCVVEDKTDTFNQILNTIHYKILNQTDLNEILVPPSAQGVKNV